MRVVLRPSVIAISPPARHDPLERREADEGVAAHLLAALDRFQQKALRAPATPRAERPRPAFPGRPSGCGRREQACAPGERQELLAAGQSGTGRRFHSLSVPASSPAPSPWNSAPRLRRRAGLVSRAATLPRTDSCGNTAAHRPWNAQAVKGYFPLQSRHGIGYPGPGRGFLAGSRRLDVALRRA